MAEKTLVGLTQIANNRKKGRKKTSGTRTVGFCILERMTGFWSGMRF